MTDRIWFRRPAGRGLNGRFMMVVLVLAGLIACATDAPTVSEPGQPRQPAPVPVPVPTPVPKPFPPLSRPGVIYDRVTASYIPGSSRYVLYSDSTFGLQYNRPDWGFFEYPGKLLRADSVLTFYFDGWNTAGPWIAMGVVQGDSLTVKYNMVMMLADFEDGVYRSSTSVSSPSGARALPRLNSDAPPEAIETGIRSQLIRDHR